MYVCILRFNPQVQFLGFLYSPPRFFGIKSCFDGVLFFKMQLKNILVYIFGAFTLSAFITGFFWGGLSLSFLAKGVLLFICISYLLKVFDFDTGILCDSCTVSLLKTLSRLPEYSYFIPDFISHVCLQSFHVSHLYNKDLLNINRNVSCCCTGFSCAFF